MDVRSPEEYPPSVWCGQLANANDRARLAKLVAHEAGHVLGLRHCRQPACLAAFAPDPAALDRLVRFCPRCRRRLSRARGSLP